MRALLLFNPNATTTDVRVRDVIAAALASEVDLDVHATKQRGHATHIAAGAVHEGVDAVFALGGDGTANEVIQALAGTPVVLGVIPGGGANVFARALGLPNDAVAATSVMLERLRRRQTRRISLGRANERYFGFNAGLGFDAAVVRLVEQNAHLKRALRQLSFVGLAVQEWVRGEARRSPCVEVDVGSGPRGSYGVAIVANTDPYTYLGARALHVTPAAGFDVGLSLLGIRQVGTGGLLRILAAAFSGDGRHLSHPSVDHWDDLDEFTLTAARPQPLMVDGDYAGEHRLVRFRSAAAALTVLGGDTTEEGRTRP